MYQLSFFRNRFYDQATGRWTQEDPIGVAGGINLYAYVGNNPVTFSDPFGLCADSLHDKNGKCPGGLTDSQWNRIEYAARNRMTREAGARVMSLLNAGRISVGLTTWDRVSAWLGGVKNPAAMSGHPGIHLTAQSFGQRLGDFAFLMAHESQHTVQPLFMLNKERDADAYGCANTWGREGYFAGAYSDQWSCGGLR